MAVMHGAGKKRSGNGAACFRELGNPVTPGDTFFGKLLQNASMSSTLDIKHEYLLQG
jgi:hypothetical protein